MRILTVLLVIFFGFSTALVAQNQYAPQPSQGGGQPPWMQGGGGGPQQRGQGPQGGMGRMQGGMQPPEGGPPWMQQNAAGNAGRGRQPNAMQGNQPMRGQAAGQGNQPREMNPNQVTQTLTRLRGMDTNQNGILESSEIPANQRDRINTMITQLGGNPSGQINLANLERRASATAGNNARSNQSQQQADSNANRQRRQQTVEPLVRPFGETNAVDTPVLGFGQRAADAQTPQAARGFGGRRDAAVQANQAAVRQAAMPKVSAVYDHIPPEVRNNPAFNWFFECDLDQDGQITMSEYVNTRGEVWTTDNANEFIWLDRNGDGLATVDEVLASLREFEEQRAQEQGNQLAAAPERGAQGTQSRQPPATTRQNVNPNAGNQGNQGRQPGGMNAQGRSGQQNMGRNGPGGGGRNGGPGGNRRND